MIPISESGSKVKREMKGAMSAIAVGDEEWNAYDEDGDAPTKADSDRG